MPQSRPKFHVYRIAIEAPEGLTATQAVTWLRMVAGVNMSLTAFVQGEEVPVRDTPTLPVGVPVIDARHARIVELAHCQYHKDGEVEVDENAVVSEGDDNGAYVSAWVWADFAGTEMDKDPAA